MKQETLLATPKELLEAAKTAVPGAVLVLKDGIWLDAELTLVARGTASKPITLRAQTPGKVVLTGSSRLRLSGEYLVVSGLWFKKGKIDSGEVIAFRTKSDVLAHHCRLTQCAISDVNPQDKERDTKWVSLYGTYNRVDHCDFAGKTNLGTTLVVWLAGNPNDHRIDHNHFGPRPELGTNGGETIRVGTSDWSMSVSRTIVEDNLFERCDGETEIISSKSCENLLSTGQKILVISTG
ncbi:polysaccharide lyase 6 family protein [Armatimonas sp.]|uniref:polysaccharide lyase 6 family protein n=1 Tax=Armatimonas sp. TaxID=1872638 RepID=UPI00286CB315|nr:polysaccharide lyase 6 family protein [Armatimonas sp.]